MDAKSTWEAGSIQVVWFGSPASETVASTFLEQLFKVEVLSTQSARIPAGGMTSSAAGIANDLQVQVTVQPGRVDLFVRPQANGELSATFVVKDTDAALTWLLARLAEGPAIEPANRLAMVVTLHRKAAGPVQAAAIVNELIGGVVEFPDATDLVFQVNRRRPLSFNDNVLMNRLVRLSTEAIQEVQITGNAMVPAATEISIATQMIDLNIVPTRREFSAKEQAAIWPEFAAEAMRARESGVLAALNTMTQ